MDRPPSRDIPQPLADSYAMTATAAVLDYLEACQSVGTYLLQTFHSVCEEVGVSYSIDSGTLLGAVRHQGWIPWDDDVDVVMFRDDFEKLREVINHLLPEDVKFADLRSDPTYVRSIPRLIYLPSRRKSPGRQMSPLPPERRHLFLDIFILDRNPRAAWKKRLRLTMFRLIEKLLGAKATLATSTLRFADQPVPRRVLDFVIASFAGLLPRRTLIGLLESTLSLWEKNDRDSFSVVNWFTPRARKLEWSSKDWLPTSQYMFDGHVVFGPARSNKILSRIYGADFMQPPPREQRQPAHQGTFLEASLGDSHWRCEFYDT